MRPNEGAGGNLETVEAPTMARTTELDPEAGPTRWAAAIGRERGT
jgi:hypothetical protein